MSIVSKKPFMGRNNLFALGSTISAISYYLMVFPMP